MLIGDTSMPRETHGGIILKPANSCIYREYRWPGIQLSELQDDNGFTPREQNYTSVTQIMIFSFIALIS